MVPLMGHVTESLMADMTVVLMVQSMEFLMALKLVRMMGLMMVF